MATRGGQQFIPRPPSARPGDPAPWANLGPADRRFTLEQVRARLAVLPEPLPASARAPDSVDAAVLLPLFERDGDVHIVLIKRPDSMPTHRGEIAFPGGKYEGALDDDLRRTALREAREEVGIDPGAVEVVAQLDSISTVASRFVITPFVGFLASEPVLRANPGEVVRVLDLTLSELLDDAVYRQERWDMSLPDVEMHFFELTDETIWGATARILTAFLAHLVGGR